MLGGTVTPEALSTNSLGVDLMGIWGEESSGTSPTFPPPVQADSPGLRPGLAHQGWLSPDSCATFLQRPLRPPTKTAWACLAAHCCCPHVGQIGLLMPFLARQFPAWKGTVTALANTLE